MQYEFKRIQTEYGSGYSLFTGIKTESSSHRDIIRKMAESGWRYVGFIPVSQRGNGQLEELDLVFERE